MKLLQLSLSETICFLLIMPIYDFFIYFRQICAQLEIFLQSFRNNLEMWICKWKLFLWVCKFIVILFPDIGCFDRSFPSQYCTFLAISQCSFLSLVTFIYYLYLFCLSTLAKSPLQSLCPILEDRTDGMT